MADNLKKVNLESDDMMTIVGALYVCYKIEPGSREDVMSVVEKIFDGDEEQLAIFQRKVKTMIN